jgi:hypothetical protein
MLRLLIKDITVEKPSAHEQLKQLLGDTTQ